MVVGSGLWGWGIVFFLVSKKGEKRNGKQGRTNRSMGAVVWKTDVIKT